MKVTVIIPTLNEIDGVKCILPKLKKQKIVDEILIVDGGSTDGTVEYCKNNGFKILTPKISGYGAAIKEGADKAKGEILIEFPGDGSSKPEDIPKLVSKIKEGYDMVTASRYKDGAISYDDDKITRLGNWIFTTMTNLLCRTHYTDSLIGFRACRKKSLKTLKMDATGLEWVTQSSIRFPKNGFKVAEVGCDEPKRIGGKRKMSPIKTGIKILKMIGKEYFITKQ